jgi:hypothetical protein
MLNVEAAVGDAHERRSGGDSQETESIHKARSPLRIDETAADRDVGAVILSSDDYCKKVPE